MDSRHDFTLEKVFWGYFGALDQKANSALPHADPRFALPPGAGRGFGARRYTGDPGSPVPPAVRATGGAPGGNEGTLGAARRAALRRRVLKATVILS